MQSQGRSIAQGKIRSYCRLQLMFCRCSIEYGCDYAIRCNDVRGRHTTQLVQRRDLLVIIVSNIESQVQRCHPILYGCFTDIDRQYTQPLIAKLIVKVLQDGHLDPAWLTPRRPEIDDNRIALELSETEALPFQ